MDFLFASGTQKHSRKDLVSLHIGVDLASCFVGKVYTNDELNPSDIDGEREVSSIESWSSFENPFRAWGVDGSDFPNPDNTGDCRFGTCRIWDWRLKSTDTELLNFNGVFIDGGPCPPSAHGDQALTDRQLPPHTFLVNAVEVVLDGIGNDNGLCESDEACKYSPNIGYYQGEGDYRSRTCIFQDGIVSGVTLYAYPINGW